MVLHSEAVAAIAATAIAVVVVRIEPIEPVGPIVFVLPIVGRHLHSTNL